MSKAFYSWVKKPIVNKGKKDTEEIIYPFFKECINFTDDPFWIERLHMFSFGKITRFFSYDEYNNNLSYLRNGKSDSVTLSTDPEIAVKMFINFFHSTGKI